MAGNGVARWSFRQEQSELNRLVLAIVISLAIHLLLFGGYKAVKRYGLLEMRHYPAWMRPPMLTKMLAKKNEAQPKQKDDTIPLIFVQVSPAQATQEEPKNAKFYSDKNSQAANVEKVEKETNVPKIAGTQTEVPKSEDVPRQKYQPLQPARPQAEQAAVEQPEERPKPAQPPGDLAMVRPEPKPNTTPGTAPRARPRTITEALARQHNNALPGEKMKQEGGVRRHLEIASLDAKASPFGSYDAALVEAIANRWYALLDQRDYASDGQGKVVLQFELHYDGRISEMKVAESTTPEILALLCQKAVTDPSPFATWPNEMRKVLGEVRHIQFTFYYH